MNGSELLVHMLLAHEVKHIFGVPGDTNVPLYAALDKHRNAIRHIMARDERGAGFMGDAYARVSNRPAVVEVPSGAGAMYALPAVAEAHGSSLPLILITSDTPLMYEGRGVITELDCVRLFEPITKASLMVKSAQKIPEMVRRAFRIATSGKPGAVHLVFPEDVLHEHIETTGLSLHAEANCKTFPAFPARAAKEELQQLLQLISRAERPLLVIGGGVNRSGASAALTAFVERYRLPVVTTVTGQDALFDTHELSIGIVGDNGFHPHANRAMEEADLLVYFGCRNGSVVSIAWTFPAPRAGRKAVQIDIDPAVLGNNSENVLSIHSDARLALEDLTALPKPKQMALDPNWVDTLNEWRRTYWRFADAQLETTPTNPLAPQRVIDALNRRLDKTYFLFSDPGTPTPYLNRCLRLSNPDSRLFIPRAFGGLGYAIPAVVGGYFARPDIRPIGLFGDGSLGMAAGDLESLVRLNVPAILLNFNNSCFGWIKALQRLHGPHQFMSVDFNEQDCAALARAFGMKAIRVEGDAALEQALDEAFAYTGGPIFLDIVVESIADEIPPVFNWLKKTGVDPLLVNGKQLELQTKRARESAW